MYYRFIPLADRTLSQSPGKEKVRKTIVCDAAITAPSPESLRVTVAGGCVPFSLSYV